MLFRPQFYLFPVFVFNFNIVNCEQWYQCINLNDISLVVLNSKANAKSAHRRGSDCLAPLLPCDTLAKEWTTQEAGRRRTSSHQNWRHATSNISFIWWFWSWVKEECQIRLLHPLEPSQFNRAVFRPSHQKGQTSDRATTDGVYLTDISLRRNDIKVTPRHRDHLARWM